MKFIELKSNNGFRILINVDNIIAITPDPEVEQTAIAVHDNVLYVLEPIEEILEKIRG
jgi:hypothetical protein